jgi:hypothetical protein
MKTAIAENTTALPPRNPSTDYNNRALQSMAACAQVAVDGLDQLGMHIFCITVQGAKPVIEIMCTPATQKFTAFNSKNWQMHHSKCPVKQRPFSQFFVEYRECLVTWTKWR